MNEICLKEGLSEAACNAPGPGLYIAYVLFGVALITAIVLPLVNSLRNPNTLIKTGISVAILLVVFAISYGLADDKVNSIAAAYGQDGSSVRLVGAGLIMFYIVFILAAIGLIYSEVSKALK
jgi:hypothetical protein